MVGGDRHRTNLKVKMDFFLKHLMGFVSFNIFLESTWQIILMFLWHIIYNKCIILYFKLGECIILYIVSGECIILNLIRSAYLSWERPTSPFPSTSNSWSPACSLPSWNKKGISWLSLLLVLTEILDEHAIKRVLIIFFEYKTSLKNKLAKQYFNMTSISF